MDPFEESLSKLDSQQLMLITGQSGLVQKLTDFEARFDRFEKRLFGNGQPGALANHGSRISSLETWQNSVTDKVEKTEQIDALLAWKTAAQAQISLLKWLLAVVLIPAILSAYEGGSRLIHAVVSSGHP